jgi:hypothetical protein
MFIKSYMMIVILTSEEEVKEGGILLTILLFSLLDKFIFLETVTFEMLEFVPILCFLVKIYTDPFD